MSPFNARTPAARIGVPPEAPSVRQLTLGEQFARSQRAAGYYGSRLVERFRRQGVDRFGLWFEVTLSADPDTLDPADRAYLVATWDQFVAGEHPFRRRRYVI